MRITSIVSILILAALVVGAAACSDSKKKDDATATPQPIPSPVKLPDQPAEGISLGDPKFDALPGAKADYGHLGGTVYRIEMPDNWNGRLFLYQHGFQGLAPTADVETPALRGYLISNGWAWGASSYNGTALIPGPAADQTAALWDYFVTKHGRPTRTYVGGHSMGGAATNIAAERYGNRYDGALSMCGFAGQLAQTNMVDDFFFAAAYAAGVTQAEFDASTDYPKLLDDRIFPALDDPAKRKIFEDIEIAITGGPRPFDRLGLHLEEQNNRDRAGILIAFRVGDNADRQYVLPAGGAVSSADFNAGVIRMYADPDRSAKFNEGNEITGDIQMPMIALHTTGDWQVPIDEEQILRRRVDAAGKGGSLVQRMIAAPEHCGFTNSEEEQGLSDLVAWVEKGEKPTGDDLTATDLSQAGAKFTLAPRFGSPAADAVTGAPQRVTLNGTLTIDGAPVAVNYLWADVESSGLAQTCSFGRALRGVGQLQLTIAADAEMRGCGAPGAHVTLYTFQKDKYYVSLPFDWPSAPGDIAMDAAFTSDRSYPSDQAPPPPTTNAFGTVRDSAGKHLPPGTLVEAYVGDTRCGIAALPQVVMPFSSPDNYLIEVSGPDTIAACKSGATITFRVDGKPVAATLTHDLDVQGHALDLVVP